MMKSETCRGALADELIRQAKTDPDLYVVCTDSRGSAQLDEFPKRLPEQFVEMGIAEQNAITVAAGIASMGKTVFAVGPASFYSMRSAEQVKIDVAYSRNNVKVIGISGGISYGPLGTTHQSLQDIALMRAIPDLIVEIPADAIQMRELTKELLDTKTPAYVRIGRNAVPVIYEEGRSFEIGRAERWFAGAEAAIFACGQMVWRAVKVAELLAEKNISVRVYDMHTIKPLDEEAVREAAEECEHLFSLEEHSRMGGLGGAIAEYLTEHTPRQLTRLGLPDEILPHGSDTEVFEYYGLDPQGIAATVEGQVLRR